MYKKARLFFVFLFLFEAAPGFAQEGTGKTADGKHVTRYSTGVVKEEGRYKNGSKKGVWYFYNDKGVVEKKEKYKEGVLLWQIFYEKGKVTKTIDRNGKVVERPKCGC